MRPARPDSQRAPRTRLRVPCSYQGGKQRVAAEIAEILVDETGIVDSGAEFFDLCCGSGAISVEMINKGVDPSKITMLDRGPWGFFWSSIGSGIFDLETFSRYLDEIPRDKRAVKQYMIDLASKPAGEDSAYIYPILQSCSFGGKQIWLDGDRWGNAFFRDYWEPTENSIRRSPANPMQPSPETLYRRVELLAENCVGISCLTADVSVILDCSIPDGAIVYIDPPYRGTTGYAYGFNLDEFVIGFRERNDAPLYASEGLSLSDDSTRLLFGGPKGGISGNRSGKHEEWLNRF